MSDTLLIAVGILLAIMAAFACVAVMNRAGKRPDAMQQLLDREPIFGKDFFERYYSGFPRNVVFGVRDEFARLAGVPADFLLPDDNLGKLAPEGSAEEMRGFIETLVSSSSTTGQSDAAIELATELATLDDFIRAAVGRRSEEPRNPAPTSA